MKAPISIFQKEETERLQEDNKNYRNELEDCTEEGSCILIDDSAQEKMKIILSGNTDVYQGEIKLVTGNNNIKTINKNIFDESSTPVYRSSHTTMSTQNHVISVNNDASGANGGVGWNIPVKVGSQITISYDKIFDESTVNNNNSLRYFTTDEPLTSISSASVGTQINKQDKHITITADKPYLFLFMRITNGPMSYKLSNLMVSYSSNLTYQTREEKNFPINLRDIEMLEIGTHRDEIVGTLDNWYIPNKSIKIASYNGETITTDYISTTGGLDIGATVYYVGNEDYPITDTMLIKQLNQLYYAESYYGQTNIIASCESSNLQFQMKVTAKKSNRLRIEKLEQALLAQGANV